jgi:hypothetical protein
MIKDSPAADPAMITSLICSAGRRSVSTAVSQFCCNDD